MRRVARLSTADRGNLRIEPPEPPAYVAGLCLVEARPVRSAIISLRTVEAGPGAAGTNGPTVRPDGAQNGGALGTHDQVTLETLDRAECLRLLRTVPVGRIGVSIGALPAILPVNFAVVRDRIVIRTVPGTKLDAAMSHAVVAFEVDDYAADGSWGWSVMVQGVCSEIAAPAEREAVAASRLRAWAFDGGAATRLVRIDLSFVTGRRFRRPTD